MRVLLTVPDLHPTASPFAEVSGLLSYGADLGIEYTVCSLRDSGWEEGAPLLIAQGAQVCQGRFRPTRATISQFRRAMRFAVDTWRTGSFDLQHSLDFSSNPFEVLAARAARRPMLVTVRDLGEDASLPALRLRLMAASRVVAVSHEAARLAVDHGAPPANTSVLHNGVDLDRFLYRGAGRPPGPPVLLSVGHLADRKRHQDALAVLAQVRDEFPDATLRIVGREIDPGLGAELLDRAAALGVADAVELLGQRDDVPALMASSTVFLHCAELEAFGWVLLEAAATGLPVVAVRAAGPAEIVEHEVSGLLAPPGTVSGLVTLVKGLLRSDDLYRRIATNGRLRVEQQFSAQVMAEGYAQIYEQVLVDHRPARAASSDRP